MLTIRTDQLAEVLPPGGRTLVQGCSGASALLADAVMAAGDAIGAMTFTGIQVPGLDRASWLANPGCRFETFFMTPELAAARAAVDFLPLCYTDILARLRSVPIDAALFSVSPPDDIGMCSFGPAVDFVADLWPRASVRIAHINPLLPRTDGPTGIPLTELTAAIEADAPIPTLAEPASDPVADAVAAHVAPFVENGATLQVGLGRLPGALLRALTERRGLRIHSGLLGDAVLDLVEAGAVADGGDVTVGVAIGTRRLYDALPSSGFRFMPVSYTHDPVVLAAIPHLVTINGAVEVDLFGQAHAEAMRGRWQSGPGGATDFARGARAAGGLRIVALDATAGAVSRIVAAGGGHGPVSLARTDIDVVATEHGAADLRGLGHDARAAALIAVAAPEHREALARSWRDGPGKF